MKPSLADLRREYALKEFTEETALPDPIEQFGVWFTEALDAAIPDANAMTLATVRPDHSPAARILLLKGFDERGFVFFTNYDSRKAGDLRHEPRASMVFWWDELERQLIVSGTTQKVSKEESEAYFRSRPRGSQIGAWASRQSAVLGNRSELEEEFRKAERKYGDGEIPRPVYWGGYLLVPERFEFWQGRPSRLHDRLEYVRENDGSWRIQRLSP